MGMCPEDFKSLTPAEFVYAWYGWSGLQQDQLKQSWERERWSVWITTCIQLDKKDRLSMTDMFPLPWDCVAAGANNKELTMEERKERINEILKCIKD